MQNLINTDLLNIAEGKSFDRKSAAYEPIKLANILIAFVNADGGTVVIGIKDKKYDGIKSACSQKNK